ncbi:MAG: diguanylate cyclase [Desulfobacteraceae bacterium]|nr:diguanylate cyclase [Desulfobacteraceae bacterium]
MIEPLSIYLLLPILSLVSGIILVVLALAKGQINREKMLFVLVCIWYSLLAPNFICHHLVKNADLILTIERRVHFIYVFLPAVVIAFHHQLLDVRRNKILLASIALSFLISITTQSNLYIQGLNHFQWGYIAKGGISFHIFGLYCGMVYFYCLYLFIKRLRVETNPRLKLKFKYILFSFGMTGTLTFLNIPAMNGIDLYPPGNFSFIPLLILAYGMLKYRLLDFGSLLLLSLARFLMLLLIIVPNYLLFGWGLGRLGGLAYNQLFVLLTLWFLANHLYILWVRKIFQRWVYKARYGLKLAEGKLIRELLELRDANDLSAHVNRAMQSCLPIGWARVYVYDDARKAMISVDGTMFEIADDVVNRLGNFRSILEISALDHLSALAGVQTQVQRVLSQLNAAYAIALIHKEAFVGLLTLPAKHNRKPIMPDEAAFIRGVATTLAVALSNAVMYQRITTLKDHLQVRTDALSEEIVERKRVEADLQIAQGDLRQANIELETSILQANEMRAKVEITNYVLRKEMEDRRRVEEALRQSEKMYRLLADNSADVIWTIDLEDNFTYMSPSVYHLLQYTPEEMLQMKTSHVLTIQSYQLAINTIAEEFKAVTKASGRNKDRSLELEQVRKDGTTVWTEVNTRFVKDAAGTIIGIVGMTRDITRRRQSEQELHYMAYHDALTGLYNRKAFIELLDNEIKYALRYQSGLAVLFFDLNKFKQANDTYGHEVGDRLLKAVAERLKVGVRETDLIARFGGDEFTIILRNPEEIFPDLVAKRIVESFAKPFHFGEVSIGFVGVSIGIATFPKDGTTTAALMKNADLAMYEAKKGAINWLHFDSQMAKVG